MRINKATLDLVKSFALNKYLDEYVPQGFKKLNPTIKENSTNFEGEIKRIKSKDKPHTLDLFDGSKTYMVKAWILDLNTIYLEIKIRGYALGFDEKIELIMELE